ncbi:MAG: DUF983 domain-containing protein [Flavobacteriales bacterium]|nr:DUF983 domain-containing protein [Flavobacteriales bacterium]
MFPAKGTKLYSIVHSKCPFCHEGQFFVSHPYDLAHAGDLLAACPVCQEKYSREPGFYYGAMYVSYAIGVAVCVSLWVAFLVLAPATPLGWQVGAIAGVMVLAAPWFYALSKILWANMFFSYKGKDRKVLG